MMNTIRNTILLVEDEILYRMQIRKYLARYQQVYEAGDLAEAKDELMAHPDIDLILLDLGLPDSNGDTLGSVTEITHFIRAAEHIEDVPIVVLTGETDEELWQQAMVAGATEYLEKARIKNGYAIEQTVRSAIFRKAQEAVIKENQQRWQTITSAEWRLATRMSALMHDLPERSAYEELINVYKAIDAVPRTANKNRTG